MPFTIIKHFDEIPSYPFLCKLAGQNNVQLTGDEHLGSFSFRGGEGDYAFGEDGIRGTFGGHGVTGTFCFEIGKAAVTINDKPFWLPEVLLKQKIAEALDTLWKELVLRRSS